MRWQTFLRLSWVHEYARHGRVGAGSAYVLGLVQGGRTCYSPAVNGPAIMCSTYTLSSLELKALDLSAIDLQAMASLATHIARQARRGNIITLSGPMGAGKTTFVQYFMAALGVDPATVTSPTYTLVHVYEPPAHPDGPNCAIWHLDLYRLPHPEEALELGLEEAFAEAITLIEWPEKLGGHLPPTRLDIHLGFVEKEKSAADGFSLSTRTVRLDQVGGGYVTAFPSWRAQRGHPQ